MPRRRPQAGPGARDRLLRPALEAAVAVARERAAADPPVPAPPALRPVLRFARLAPAALETVRRVVDADDEFRRVVAEEVVETELGRPGWLWLVRPEGWEADLDAFVHEVEVAAAEDSLVAEVERLRSDLHLTEASLEGARSDVAAASAEATAAREALASERAARREATGRAEEAEAALVDVAAERTAAIRELKQAQADLASARHALKEAQRAERGARAEAERLAAAATVAAPVIQAEGADVPRPAVPSLRPEVADAVRRAAEASAELARSLAEAARALEPAVGPQGADPPHREPRRSRGGRPRQPVRRPLRLPPPLVDNTAEAADHLVRVPGIMVLVDGYNVAMAAWPGPPIAEQRERLVLAVEELESRTGADLTVVFDGSTGARRPAAAHARRVKVAFTAEHEIADDRIVEIVAGLPVSVPVLVVTSDRELQGRVRDLGANVVSARPFLAVLRR